MNSFSCVVLFYREELLISSFHWYRWDTVFFSFAATPSLPSVEDCVKDSLSHLPLLWEMLLAHLIFKCLSFPLSTWTTSVSSILAQCASLNRFFCLSSSNLLIWALSVCTTCPPTRQDGKTRKAEAVLRLLVFIYWWMSVWRNKERKGIKDCKRRWILIT